MGGGYTGTAGLVFWILNFVMASKWDLQQDCRSPMINTQSYVMLQGANVGMQAMLGWQSWWPPIGTTHRIYMIYDNVKHLYTRRFATMQDLVEIWTRAAGIHTLVCTAMTHLYSNDTFLQQWRICTAMTRFYSNDTFVQQWHVCTAMTQLHSNDTFAQQWRIFTAMTHLYSNDTFVQQWHVFAAMTRFYINDTFLQQWHVFTAMTRFCSNDTFVQQWHVCTAMTRLYSNDTFLQQWRIFTAMTRLYSNDTFVQQWHICTAMTRLHSNDTFLGLARTVNAHRIWPYMTVYDFPAKHTVHTPYIYIYICMVLANPTHFLTWLRVCQPLVKAGQGVMPHN